MHSTSAAASLAAFWMPEVCQGMSCKATTQRQLRKLPFIVQGNLRRRLHTSP